MNYHNITTEDMLNGEGLRTVLWVAGCSHHCKGCQNPITWDPEGGVIFDDSAEKELLTKLSKDYISGVTFSGGDPLHPSNIREITRLANVIKEQMPEKTIWLYTGYDWEDIWMLPVIRLCKVVVEGEFIEEYKDMSYPWAGSWNQRVIDVKKSLMKGCAVRYGD